MRRRTLAGALALATVVPLLVVGAASAPAQLAPTGGGAEPPNVLIVVTDDHRVGEGALGILSETVTRFGDAGRRFKRAYATTPTCCPSRASILTGQYSHNHRVRDNQDTEKLDQTTTLEFNLKRAGYATAIFGKFLNDWEGQPPYFDRWAIPEPGEGNRYRDGWWNVNGNSEFVTEYSADWLGDLTIDHLEILEADDDQPWFTYVAPHAPHAPYVPAERHQNAEMPTFEGNPAVFEKDRSDKPGYVRRHSADFADAQRIADLQLKTLLAVDEMMARIDDALTELGEHENTLVFFIGDNGYTWGEHGLLGSGVSKNSPYLPSVRVPMLMRWPAGVEAGTRERRLTANIDIAPTIYDATQLNTEVEHVTDGRSLLNTGWQRDWLLLEKLDPRNRHTFPTWRAIVGRNKQYIETYSTSTNEVKFREFYDFESDPWQLENLLGDRDPANDPADTRLHRKLVAFRACAGRKGARPCP